MDLLLFTSLRHDIPLAFGYPRIVPWNQMVNRVIPGKIDPFHYTLTDETIDDILKLPQNNKSFEKMCSDRVDELFKIAKGRPIYIMWSGGIDSSATILTFMICACHRLSNVHVIVTHESVIEFPKMWNLITKIFKGRIHNGFTHPEKYCKKGILVTGECGDQIFGSDVLLNAVRHSGEESIHKAWEETIPTIYSRVFQRFFGDDGVKVFIDRYEPLISACPFPIKSTFDWLWWFNFTNKWQLVKHRVLMIKGWTDPKAYFPNVHHFFNTPDWQRWSLDNHDEKIKDTMDSYKFAAKHFIVTYTGFKDYMKKEKVGSMSNIWMFTPLCDGLSTTLETITFDQCLEYVRR